LISGYYGFGNAGDEAVLLGITRSLRDRASDLDIVVLSAAPRRTEMEHDVRAVSRTNLGAILREMRGAHLVISGGGSLLQDVTSLRSLGYYTGIIYLAGRLGVPVMIYGQGIGPVRTGPGRWLVSAVVNGVDLITVRDSRSIRELKRLGVTRPPVKLSADPALALEPAAESDRARSLLHREGVPLDGRPLVGLCPREWGGHELAEGLARLADQVTERLGARVVLVPLHLPEDLSLAAGIARRSERGVHVLRRPLPVRDLLGVFGQFSLVVGVRLHALIFAAVNRVPMVGISYDPKVEGFLADLGEEPVRVEGLAAAELTRKVEEVWGRREGFRTKLAERLPQLRRLAAKSAEAALSLMEV